MFDSIILNLRNVFRKGLRTSLTILGIAVGVMSVLLIKTISDVGIKTVNAELDSLGLNGISVSANKSTVTNDDLTKIKKLSGVENAMPIITTSSKISQDNKTQEVFIWGVDSGAKQVVSINILHGRSFERFDILAKENVCLLDESAAKKVFGRENVLGKKISLQIGDGFQKFKIIGITESGSGILQSIMGNIVPCFCYIPYTTLQSISGSEDLYQIAVKLKDEDLALSVSNNIENLLDNEKGIKDSVKTGDLAASRSTLSGLLDTITVIFTVVGIISLLVAGLGIMTVMLVSVNERTREIGIKKAIGASFFNIMSEFLCEALTICIIGSIIGLSLGFLCVLIGSLVLNIKVSIGMSSFLLAIISAILVGVLFGLYPAYKAAKMKVVDALRYE